MVAYAHIAYYTHKFSGVLKGEGGTEEVREVEREVDLFLESEEEQFTFEEFYCTLPPWARGRQKEVLAALKRRVAGEANHGRRRRLERGHGTSSCSDPILSARLELSNSDDVTRSD